MATLFTKIIRGELPAHRIAECSTCFAFLDINPVRPGHVLLVPKREVDYFYDLSDQEITSLMHCARRIAHAIQEATGCVKVGTAIMGLEINHAHIHLLPLNELGDMNMYDKTPQTEDELSDMAERIRRYIPADMQ